nr:unnamed protein product [Haemonchus contortus]
MKQLHLSLVARSVDQSDNAGGTGERARDRMPGQTDEASISPGQVNWFQLRYGRMIRLICTSGDHRNRCSGLICIQSATTILNGSRMRGAILRWDRLTPRTLSFTAKGLKCYDSHFGP